MPLNISSTSDESDDGEGDPIQISMEDVVGRHLPGILVYLFMHYMETVCGY